MNTWNINKFMFGVGITLQSICQAQINTQRIPVSALEYLYIVPDARHGSMGAGAASSPSAYSTATNVAVPAFCQDFQAFSLNYTPWNIDLVKDMRMLHFNAYGRTDENGRWNVSLSHFNYGKAELRDDFGNYQGEISSYDMNLRLAHARKLTQNLSVGVGLRSFYSNLFSRMAWQGFQLRPVFGVNADLGVYWRQERSEERDWFSDWGISIHHLGGRISYGDDKRLNFQPTLFRAGVALSHPIDKEEEREVQFYLDALKQLVPTPPVYGVDGKLERGNDPIKQSGIRTIFTSWADAPDGVKEEIQEIWWAMGGHYQHNSTLALRLNYFTDHRNKGNRHLLTVGLGLMNLNGKKSALKMDLDASYTLSVKGYNPLNHSFQIGLLVKRQPDE